MKPETALAWVAALFLGATLFSHTVTLRLWLLAAGIVLASITVARQRNAIHALPPIWIPFALWASWAALSLIWSVEPDRSLKEWRNEVFYSGSAVWICFVAAQTPRAMRVILPLVAVAAAGACLVALHNFFLGWERYQTGFHGGPGNHSSALLTLMPCVAMALWYGRRAVWPWARLALCFALGALFVVSAYATLNRTVWLGFGVQLALIGIFLLFKGPERWSPRKIAFTSTFALALVLGTAIAVLQIQAQRDAMGGARTFEKDSRLELWPEVVERIGERPLLGYGFGRGLLRDSLRDELGDVDPFLWHAHNIFLEALLQLGIPGLLLFLILLGAIVREAWQLGRQADSLLAACGLALVALLAGMLMRNMTDMLFLRQNALLFWGVVGVLLALGSRRT